MLYSVYNAHKHLTPTTTINSANRSSGAVVITAFGFLGHRSVQSVTTGGYTFHFIRGTYSIPLSMFRHWASWRGLISTWRDTRPTGENWTKVKWEPNVEMLIRDVNDHKCSSIIKLRYLTDSIPKRNENVQNSLSSDRKKNRNVYRENVLFINKTKRNEMLIFWAYA